MTARKTPSASYDVGYGKPPRHTQFSKGRSGNPTGKRRSVPIERAKALVLSEAYREITIKQDGRTVKLPAMQAVLRSQFELAAKGNLQAQRALFAVVEGLEFRKAQVQSLHDWRAARKAEDEKQQTEDEETSDEDEPEDSAPSA